MRPASGRKYAESAGSWQPAAGGSWHITAIPGGIRIRIHVQPRASRTEIAGRHGDALKVRLAAPPVDGAANDALLDFIADRLGVPRARG